MTKGSSSADSSFFKQSDFIDPLVRINKMKFLTSEDIRVASKTKFACLDIRLKKVPKLTDIFKPNNPVLPQTKEVVPVFELDLQPKQVLKEHHFKSLEGYQLVIVLSNSLEVDYLGREHES